MANAKDTLTFDGASALVVRIQDHWQSQGRRPPEMYVSCVKSRSARAVFVVRSNMVDGRPPCLSAQSQKGDGASHA